MDTPPPNPQLDDLIKRIERIEEQLKQHELLLARRDPTAAGGSDPGLSDFKNAMERAKQVMDEFREFQERSSKTKP